MGGKVGRLPARPSLGLRGLEIMEGIASASVGAFSPPRMRGLLKFGPSGCEVSIGVEFPGR